MDQWVVELARRIPDTNLVRGMRGVLTGEINNAAIGTRLYKVEVGGKTYPLIEEDFNRVALCSSAPPAQGDLPSRSHPSPTATSGGAAQ